MYKKILSLLCCCVAFASVFSIQAAAAPTDTYNKVDVPGNVTELRLSREMYSVTKYITASSLGLQQKLDGITDVFASADGSIYLLCGDKSRLLKINSDLTLNGEITVSNEKGETVGFSGAKGVYCDKNGNIYIADTANARVTVTDSNGKIIKTMELPDSDLIPSDFIYQPIAVSKDYQGYTYILSRGCYYGVLMYSPEDEFLGFYGANTVKSTALDTLSYLWDKLTSNDEKKSNSVKTLPYSFSDFCFDSEGYMVTCTGRTGESRYLETGQIRKISHNGSNIMYKRTLRGETEVSSSMNFLENQLGNPPMRQNLVSIAVSPDDYIYALDTVNGTVYVYDMECNLLAAFGGGKGEGEQIGVFKTAVSLTFSDTSLLVADAANCSVTVFEPTEYKDVLCRAQTAYLSGDYVEAKQLWQEVLSMNRNCQLAYRGLAMAYYNEGNYEAALEAAKIAVDYSVYDLARSELMSRFISDNFIWILFIAVIIIAAIVYCICYLRKRNKKLIKNQKLLLMLKTPFHPFQSFEDLKYSNMGSVKIAVVLTVLFYISSVLNVIESGFLYQDTLLRNYNSLFTLAGTVGLLLLWSICNWLVCSIFSGKGRFKEVYVSTTYALVPWIVVSFVKVVLSNLLPLSNAGLLAGVGTATLIYTFFLLSVAMMKMHEFDFFKFIITSLVTIFFMILIVFVILMISILLKQLAAFITSVYEEIVFR